MNDAPDADTVEVSLIGPGYGESVVVHLGNGEWLVVDSCEDSLGLARSAAVTYLTGIDVDLASQVKCVLATHWHDDHIEGMSELVDRCASATFCCPVTFNSKEFLTLASFYADFDPSPNSRSTREILEVLEILDRRNARPKFLASDRQVMNTQRGIKVFALSPSDDRVGEFLSFLATIMPAKGKTMKRVRDVGPNETSVVLLIDLGDDAILLGADLEETPGRGWSSIITNSAYAKEKRSSVYKVAHHGSKTAECADIWEKLLLPEPFAILTPFSKGSVRLPGEEDVRRILRRTSNAYSSARPGSTGKTPRRETSVEKTIREGNHNLRRTEPMQGHVRLRRRLEDPDSLWSVDLYGNAIPLKDVWIH